MCPGACGFPRALEGTSWAGDAGPVPECSAADAPVAVTLSPKPDLPGCGCKVLAPGAVAARTPISLIPPMQGSGGVSHVPAQQNSCSSHAWSLPAAGLTWDHEVFASRAAPGKTAPHQVRVCP